VDDWDWILTIVGIIVFVMLIYSLAIPPV